MRRDDSVLTEKLSPGIARRIIRFAWPYRRKLLLFVVLIVIDALVAAAVPFIYKTIIDRGIQGHDTNLIVILGALLGVIAVADALLAVGSRYISARVGEGLIFDMRTKVFAHFQSMPIAFFTRTQTGALVSRLNTDVLQAKQAFTDTFSSVFGNIVSVTVTLIAMLILAWQITIVALIMVPLVILPVRWMGKRIQAITRESYNLNASMTATMIERFNVAGALLVKLFGQPQREVARFEDRAGRVRDIGVTQAMYSVLFRAGLLLAASLGTALVYGWGGILAATNVLEIGTVIALTTYLNRLFGPLTALSNVQVDILTALVSFDRVFEVLDLEPMIKEKADARTIARGPARIEFANVDFSYPAAEEVSLASLESVAVLGQTVSQQVLDDVSFVVPAGHLVALVGPSGAGKTTISHLIPRLYDVRTGSVRINGIDVRDATLASIHDVVGMVTQDSHMFHDTIRANLLYAKPDATDVELLEVLRAAQILPLVESLDDGLDTLVGDRGYRLSGGEKQRMAIARLLLKAPDIVVLDEATAHLDSESEVAVQQALKSALTGRTAVVIAHRLSTVRDADQILVVVGGQIAERGTHTDLLAANGEYADLYRAQFQSQDDEGGAAVSPIASPASEAAVEDAERIIADAAEEATQLDDPTDDIATSARAVT
ncbi:MAG: ABC transporter ATP-binding protein [Candidatus Limnocylindrales bacterium]